MYDVLDLLGNELDVGDIWRVTVNLVWRDERMRTFTVQLSVALGVLDGVVVHFDADHLLDILDESTH